MMRRSIDLNLLIVFNAIMQDRSVTRAAQRLGLTQPAISQALGRLRSALRDDLFIRTPDGMEPTPRAERLAEPVGRALSDLATALDPGETFDAAATERRFTVAMNNYAALVLAAPVANAVAAEAPGISLDIRPSGTLDLSERLDMGELDVAISHVAASAERFSDMRVLEDEYVAVVRRGHPATKDGTHLSVEALAALPHLTLSSTGEGTGFIDDELGKRGLARYVALRAPLLAAPTILFQSEMCAVLSARTARAFARTTSLDVLLLPFPSPKLTVAMVWHRRLDDVPAHRWLRSLIFRVAREL
jgi:DNA-binding transcriptional LysR family regulator